MADIPFSMKQLYTGRAIFAPTPYSVDMRLRNIEAALIEIANTMPDRAAALRVWDALLNATPATRMD